MANSYLNKTASNGERKKCTFSAWIKKSPSGSDYPRIFSSYIGATDYLRFNFNRTTDGEKLQLYIETSGAAPTLLTNRSFRDPSAWYHLVFAIDTTLATADDRMKLYVNGVQETSFATRTNPSQNQDFPINSSSATMYIGRQASSSAAFFNGYMSHVSFVDGTALTPSSFGVTDSTSGIWKFKPPTGVTWGTNGFHLKFENSGAMGTDSSGNTNTFTVNGNLKQALDTPSNVYATWNPLAKLYNGTYTFTNGNTTCEVNVRRGTHSTLGASSGKFYWETKLISNNNTNNNATGISAKHSTGGNDGTGEAAEEYIYKSDGQKTSNNTSSSYGNSYTNGDIIGVAMDLDNNKLYFSKNGTWQNSGVPTSVSTGTGAISITAADSTTDGFYVANAGNENDTAKWSANFGNGYFGTTAISSAGSNGNGSLFEYDVPSGYYALNTKNINTYG